MVYVVLVDMLSLLVVEDFYKVRKVFFSYKWFRLKYIELVKWMKDLD